MVLYGHGGTNGSRYPPAGMRRAVLMFIFVAILVCVENSSSEECMDRISAYQCQHIKAHGACKKNYQRAKKYCPKTCGFCSDGCHRSKFGCCRDGVTLARGAKFYGCKEKCKDKNRKYFCHTIARVGFCSTAYGLHCQKTCKLCRPCLDSNPKACKIFARAGRCEKYKPTTYNHCRRSCHVCDEKDPCHGKLCYKNRRCRVDHQGKPYCACQRHCEPLDHYTGLVCGRDSKEYKNVCHLKHSNCELPDAVEVKNYGQCQKVWTTNKFKAAFSAGLAFSGTCENTVFGCCVDGHSFAQGRKFQGCPSTEKCEDVYGTLCSRFRPDCSSPINKGHMRLYCPKTCFYCHQSSFNSVSK